MTPPDRKARKDPAHPPTHAPHKQGNAGTKGKAARLDYDESARLVVEYVRSGKAPTKAVRERMPVEFQQAVNHFKASGPDGLAEWREGMESRRQAEPERIGEVLAAFEKAGGGFVGFVGDPGGGNGVNSAPQDTSEGGFVGFVGDPEPEIPQFEGDPRVIDYELLDVMPLDLGWFPAPLRAWAKDIADRGSFPIEYPVASILVVLSSLLAGKVAIRPKRYDTWTVIVNLWGLLVGKAGMTKSPSVKESMSPLNRLAKRAAEAFADVMKRAMIDVVVNTAKKKAAQTALDKAATARKDNDHLQRLAADLVETVEMPVCRRYEINDPSIEKLGELLRDNSLCPLLFRDEIDGLFETFSKDGHGGDRKFYLECWSGDGSYSFDRIGRGTTVIKSMRLALFGTIQPGPLAKHMKAAVSGTQADGFMNRYQIVVWPDHKEYVHVDRLPDRKAQEDAFTVFDWLDSMNPAMMEIEYDEAKEIHFVRYADDAQAIADAWHTENQQRCRGGSESQIMASHLSKYSSLMPSLALLHHVVESVGSFSLDPVSARSVKVAIQWCKFFESHSRRIYQSVSDGDPAIAASLSSRLKKLENPFTPRTVALKGWSGLTTVEDVIKALGILEDRNHVKAEEVKAERGSTGGRPSVRYWIHPAILAKTVNQ